MRTHPSRRQRQEANRPVCLRRDGLANDLGGCDLQRRRREVSSWPRFWTGVSGLHDEEDHKIIVEALKGKYIGYLDDIFVDPEYRGQKIGKKLLNKIKEISKVNNWNLVRWQTDEDNLTAKKLYDKVATKTKKNVYELK